MLIAGNDKDLVAAVHSQLNSSMLSSGELKCIVRLESSDSDDGKYWDEASATWEASPVTHPSGSHLEAGMWSYTLSGVATLTKAGSTVHYTFTDDLQEDFATTICGGGEHFIRQEDPLTTADVTLVELVPG